MVIARIEALLRQRIGLDAVSIGATTLERALRERSAVTGCQDMHAYLDLVLASEPELQELIEAVVVPESWFFRDRRAFEALARIAQDGPRHHPDGVLRVLSLPCSTGEEPYSIAMTLLDAGMSLHQFQVDAVDISARVIARADSGIYGKNSFRGSDLEFRDRHFLPMGSAYCLNENVRRKVRLHQGNLFDPGIAWGAQTFDVVFCRNVLIYFDRPAQVRAVAILNRLLASTGVLFVGPSETALLQDQGYVSAKLPLAFAFRKAIASPRTPTPPVRSLQPMLVPGSNAPAGVPAPGLKQRSAHAPRPSVAVADAPRPSVAKNWIEEAQQMADRGNLAEALAYCETHMKADTPSARAFCLLGLLHDAAGRTQQACDQYRKALYLDPDHEEALLHLAMALRRGGDESGAQRLFERAKRAQVAGK
ncbi:CheR family methyltransferase [Povalibacter sp.]|uniref:CheR family methyltransferase n=1 Tax=Povalibacter sp. TaxID=1962978 RepID=UPI002F408428